MARHFARQAPSSKPRSRSPGTVAVASEGKEDEFVESVKGLGVIAMPGKSGTTRAHANNRTLNIRIAMAAAKEAFGDIEAGDRFETISYPGGPFVLVRRAL